jgi:dihydrofolate reductase
MNSENNKPLSIIVAVAENYAIGFKNQLLWHIPEDFKWFKTKTSGHTVIMGKNTYYSLPKRPLPDRRNIVISDIQGELIEGAEMAYSIDEAILMADKDKENFIIGGASIYKQFFEKVQKLYITWVHKSFEADTFFPEITSEKWELQETHPQLEAHKDGLTYDFNIYLRKHIVD